MFHRDLPRLIFGEQLDGRIAAVLSFCQQRTLSDFTLGYPHTQNGLAGAAQIKTALKDQL